MHVPGKQPESVLTFRDAGKSLGEFDLIETSRQFPARSYEDLTSFGVFACSSNPCKRVSIAFAAAHSGPIFAGLSSDVG